MTESSFRARDPRCSRARSPQIIARAGDAKKFSGSSPISHQPLSSMDRSFSAKILPDKDYDPESPISDINVSPSPVHHSPPPISSPPISSPPILSPVSNSSFLVCVVCGTTPSAIPLYGCELSHIVCSTCRTVGGSLLSCPRCGSQDISHHLTIAEELLEAELKNNCLMFCPYKVEGCSTVTRGQVMSQHKEQCLFR